MKLGIFKGLFQKVDALFSRGVDEELFDELEEILLSADMNVRFVDEVITTLRTEAKEQRLKTADDVQATLKRTLIGMLNTDAEARLTVSTEKPTVYLFVGVNGVGKTTSIAKLADRYRRDGNRVLMAAADTFRAAAIDQLEIWATRTDSDIVRHREGSDPSAVVFDAITAAKARNVDYVLADTAGRQHSNKNLMDELRKVVRVTEKALGRPPDETLLVLDAATGQNAIRQAQEFMDAVKVTGIVLTKLDGTARGGAVVAISQLLKLPIKLIGTGEGVDDLRDFHPKWFVDAVF